MRTNSLKRKLKAGQPTIGALVGFPSPAMVETLGWLGMDFVVIDCEHGIMDYETAEHMIRAAELSDITPIVRIGMNIQQHIQRYLDGGAAGVMIPFVNEGAQARAVVDAVKYPPVGKRGLFGGRGSRYGIQPIPDYVREANEETFIALQIETLEGLDHQDAIIATPEVDVIFLGPGDLSAVLSVPGQMTHPTVVSTIEGLVPKILAAGKQAGTIALDGKQAAHWHTRGVNWLLTGTNRLFTAGARQYLQDCRQALAGGTVGRS
jgi:4-hydroxy-2-oxoheptanedioate aldolase